MPGHSQPAMAASAAPTAAAVPPTSKAVYLKSVLFPLTVSEPQVRCETAEIFITISHVQMNLSSARHLYSSLLRANKVPGPPGKVYFESTIRNTQDALRAVQVIVEPLRIDELERGTFSLGSRAKWAALDKAALDRKMDALIVNHHALTRAVGLLHDALPPKQHNVDLGSDADSDKVHPALRKADANGKTSTYSPSAIMTWKRKTSSQASSQASSRSSSRQSSRPSSRQSSNSSESLASSNTSVDSVPPLPKPAALPTSKPAAVAAPKPAAAVTPKPATVNVPKPAIVTIPKPAKVTIPKSATPVARSKPALPTIPIPAMPAANPKSAAANVPLPMTPGAKAKPTKTTASKPATPVARHKPAALNIPTPPMPVSNAKSKARASKSNPATPSKMSTPIISLFPAPPKAKPMSIHPPSCLVELPCHPASPYHPSPRPTSDGLEDMAGTMDDLLLLYQNQSRQNTPSRSVSPVQRKTPSITGPPVIRKAGPPKSMKVAAAPPRKMGLAHSNTVPELVPDLSLYSNYAKYAAVTKNPHSSPTPISAHPNHAQMSRAGDSANASYFMPTPLSAHLSSANMHSRSTGRVRKTPSLSPIGDPDVPVRSIEVWHEVAERVVSGRGVEVAHVQAWRAVSETASIRSGGDASAGASASTASATEAAIQWERYRIGVAV